MKEKKKIYILTFQESFNFGALLQAYALQRSIYKLGGVEAEIIDYHSRNKAYEYTWLPSMDRSLRQNIHHFLSMYFFIKRRAHSDKFKNKFLRMTRRYSAEKLWELTGMGGYFICGSDQVWNLANTRGDWNYYLDFVSDRDHKISYAASIAVKEIKNKYLGKFKREILSFDDISVRGYGDAELIKDIVGRQTNTVIDPTLLLDAGEWDEVENALDYHKDFVLLYSLGMNKDILAHAIKEVNRQGNLTIIAPVFDLRSWTICKKLGFTPMILTPGQFINAVRNAKCVITDSYHGIIFSILYRKKCQIIKKNETYDTGRRIKDLVDMLSLNTSMHKGNIIISDYGNIDITLEKRRHEALGFLSRALEFDI